jgi:hypothetical protein
MSTLGITVNLTQVNKNDVYMAAGTAVLAAGVKDLDQANRLTGLVCTAADNVPGGTHVSGGVYLTVSPTSLSGSISLSAGSPLPVPVQPEPKADAAPSSSEPGQTPTGSGG